MSIVYMEGAPSESILPQELRGMYEKVKSNPAFANISESEFMEFRNLALGVSSPNPKNIMTHDGVMMEQPPADRDELEELNSNDPQ